MSINENTLDFFRQSMLRQYIQYGDVLDVKRLKTNQGDEEITEEVAVISAAGTTVYCTKSEFSSREVATLKGFMGTKVPFIVKEINPTGIVLVSRKEALPKVQQRFLKMVKEGDRVTGSVTGVLPDKNIVFVEVEGYPCMIPPGEFDLNLITNLEEVVALGEQITCIVKKIEEVTDDDFELDYKIRLSRRDVLKQERDLKWANIEEYHSRGDSVIAKVVYKLNNPNSYLIEIESSGIVIIGNLQAPLNRRFPFGMPLGIKVKAEILHLNKEKQEGKARIYSIDPAMAGAFGGRRGF